MYLAHYAHAAAIEDDIVLLDVRAGEYFCLAGAAEGFDLAGGRVLDSELVAALGELDLTSPRPQPPLSKPGPLAGQLDATPAKLGAGEMLDAVASYAAMVGTYYRQPFGQIVKHAQRGRGREPVSADERLYRRVTAFRTWLPWAPFPGVCLFRSFMLLAFLRQAGLDATWTFGVRTWPFEAHCWLQADGVVLDDTLDNVRGYAPIFWI